MKLNVELQQEPHNRKHCALEDTKSQNIMQQNMAEALQIVIKINSREWCDASLSVY